MPVGGDGEDSDAGDEQTEDEQAMMAADLVARESSLLQGAKARMELMMRTHKTTEAKVRATRSLNVRPVKLRTASCVGIELN